MKSFPARSIRPVAPKPRLHSYLRYLSRHFYKGPFVAVHLMALAVFFVEFSWLALALCAAFYVVRMFGITAGYHRYFAHRAFKTSRWFQFILAFIGCSAAQKGPLWWSANHRSHHKHSDGEDDPHSPVRHGFFWSHVGWVLYQSPEKTDLTTVKDLTKFPELRLLERLQLVPPVCLASICYLLDGWSGVVWGFLMSTVLLYHGTFMVNSICHIIGRRRFKTADQSRNNAIVAVLTLGEGWHNNHHHYQSSANQGFRWWEIDISYYVLCVLSFCRVVWDLRRPPADKLVPSA